MAESQTRVLDKIFLLYFITHIPISAFIDLQAVFPKWMFPNIFVAQRDWFCREFKDSMFLDTPPFYYSFCICEALLQFPFFFVASYAYYKGAASCRWIRLPVIVYSSHVMTTVIAIAFHILLNDFSTSKSLGPSTLQERLALLAVYSPFFILPAMMLVDALFSKVYNQLPKKPKKH